ncbi:MAG: hypothetical protein LIO62_06350 [Clostridiales bacterium]|nr:hypothetical protein [Clostridiales bacterium]
MSLQKRLAIVFLSVLSVINIAAGAVTELTMMFGWDITSVIPIKWEITENQILLLNFSIVVLIVMLINIVSLYLFTDVPYSPKEVFENLPTVFMLIPAVIFIVAIYNCIKVPISSDKLWIVLSAVFYVFASAVNFSCLITVKDD